ncbi:MAG: hypothetical protein EUB_03727 [Eubacterium sp.]|uniref:Gp49 family protein n=1 Tax=Eubacterium sp. TaxID=142586 RepID=UPI0030280665
MGSYIYISVLNGECPPAGKECYPIQENRQMESNVSITQEMVDRFIKKTEIMKLGPKTTIVRAILINGFEIVKSSSCIDPNNYDEKIGYEICMESIKNEIWKHLGFLLQTAYAGFDGGDNMG